LKNIDGFVKSPHARVAPHPSLLLNFMMKGEPRTYRNLIHSNRLVVFRVVVKETDLLVSASSSLEMVTRESILTYRSHIENYIAQYPEFLTTLRPWHVSGPAPAIVREMTAAGEKAGVGPMAAVAGAIAESVGRYLLAYSDEVIVENGGDTFFKISDPVTVGIYAGKSPLSLRVGLRVASSAHPVSLCTSSGTVGHSLSFGKADAVCVMSDSCALADAVATAVGNRVQTSRDIQPAVEFGKSIPGVMGLAVIIGKDMGLWGDLELIPLQGKSC
jgi:ApbE superfamily uncharacterized protein (UPF0280 family)